MSIETPDVRVGQVWADNDKRCAGRHVRVMEVRGTRATVQRCAANGTLLGGETRIRLDRFRPTSSGYRLVRQADGTEMTEIPPRPDRSRPASSSYRLIRMSDGTEITT